MIVLKSAADFVKMKAAGRVVAGVLQLLSERVKPGVITRELDTAVRKYIEGCGAVPTFLGYGGYPASVCISINEEVIHGIPSRREIKDGDVVSCDVGATLDGFVADAARTFIAGTGSEKDRHLVDVTRQCFFEALPYCTPDYRISDISRAVQSYAEKNGCGVVRDYVGHGIGRKMHEEPEVPNYFTPRSRQRLHAGMAICIEPMITAGTWEVKVLEDDWTVVTKDKSKAAHYENTVLITSNGPVLTTAYEEGLC